MPELFEIWINSGQSGEFSLGPGDRVSLIEITNSDNQYYQTGVLSIFDPPNIPKIGDSVMIKISGSLEFSGYIARKSIYTKHGIKHYRFQLVGKTYDLWRYTTDENALYSGLTGYIASSLISDYCPSISPELIDPSSGIEITYPLNLTDMPVGDALSRLTKLDGYRFFVDNLNRLHYYKSSGSSAAISITESDILNATPIEESDEHLVNDCLVIGGESYRQIDNIAPSGNYVSSLPSGKYIAQRFKANTSRLSAIDFYLDRNTAIPSCSLDFEIRNNVEKRDLICFEDFDDWSNLDESTAENVTLYNSSLVLLPSSTHWDRGGNYVNDVDNVWNDDIDIIDLDENTAAWDFDKNAINATIIFTFATPKHINRRFKFIAKSYFGNDSAFRLKKIYISGVNSDDWELVFDGNVALAPSTDKTTTIITGSGNWIYENVSGIKLIYNVDVSGDEKVWWYEFQAEVVDKFYDSGSVASKIFDLDWYTASKIQTNISYWGVSPDLSGSADSGAHWTELIPGETVSLSYPGQYAKFHYTIYSWSGGKETTKLYLARFSGISDPETDGQPGNKVEWSDDIHISPSDVPYPPAYTGWKEYIEPKLQLSSGALYWMVFHDPNGYWKYYYDSGTSYPYVLAVLDDGKWRTSEYGGAVPSGSMRFKLGWSRETVKARASNQASIDLYGRHFKKIVDTGITSYEAALQRALQEVSGMESVPQSGRLVIKGRVGITPEDLIQVDLPSYEISGIYDIRRYTHRIDDKGFTTTIVFGFHPYDIAAKVASLEKKIGD